MKSSGKVRDSAMVPPSQGAAPEEPAASTASINYSEIISRIEQNLGGPGQSASSHKQIIDEASGESDERTDQKVRNQQYEERKGPNIEESLARDEEASMTMDRDADQQPFRRTNTSAYYRSIERKRKRYTPSA